MKKKPAGERERFEVLLEEVREELKRVAEGHALLDHKIEEKVGRLEGRFEQRFTTLEQAVSTGFREVRQEIQQLRQQLIQLGQKLETHEKAHLSG